MYLHSGHKKQSLVISSGLEEEKEKDPIVNVISKQQVLVQYLKVYSFMLREISLSSGNFAFSF